MGTRQLTNMLVLCVDNEESILNGMETLLEGWGCEVLKAGNLPMALEEIQSRHKTPDIVLVDYHLDDGHGLDVIGGLRERIDQNLPAILITADRSPGLRDEALKEDIPILHKPVKPAALRAMIVQRRVQQVAAE